MSPMLDVGVVFGGPSAEAEVSRASAEAIQRALAQKGHRVRMVPMDRSLVDGLRGCDVVFPIAHGRMGEDGCLQGILEWLELPYVGSRVLASALAMDKAAARRMFASAGLPVTQGWVAAAGTETAQFAQELAKLSASHQAVNVVVKPRAGGSAVGVVRLTNARPEEVQKACAALWADGHDALIERWMLGREVTCGVLAVDAPRALVPIEIETPNDAFYTFAAKYEPGRSVHHCPARLSAAQTQEVQRIALVAHERLGCRHLSRADFIIAEHEVTLLEVNTLPGFTATSLFPEAAHHGGHSFGDLCDILIQCAFREGTLTTQAPMKFPDFTT